MTRPSFARKFAFVSIAAAVLHFVGETWWHFEFGQFLPMLIVDYIAITLILLGSTVHLRTGRSLGWLCGGWGFTFCLNYRAFFWRVEVMMSGGGTAEMQATTYVLGASLVFSVVMFLISMILCYEKQA